MKTKILVELTNLKIYSICPEANKDIPDNYIDNLNLELENLAKMNSSFFLPKVYDSISSKYEKLIVFEK